MELCHGEYQEIYWKVQVSTAAFLTAQPFTWVLSMFIVLQN